ncbi:MAG TPA: glycerophosphodiester phosphodiesterase family protein [Solirubrobacterales bacterium]|nr:glycerophosphodiester phosphodiesterase family protein [Solirubrobacterales bacterium]
MLNRRISLATILAVLVGLFGAASATAAQPSDRAPIPPPTDYWQDKGFILMAHQGGEWDFPPNTLFSYKSAVAAGADMIDMDAYVTADGQIVLTHDLGAWQNSDAPNDGNHDINDLTLAQLKEYDFAYKWSPRDGSSTHPYRGIAGQNPTQEPPAGFTRNDFTIPSFAEVLAAFPDTPINIELKQVPGVDIEDTAAEMASVLAAHPGHDESVIINSFGQDMLDAMHAARPEHKSFGGSLAASVDYLGGAPITPTPVAIEPPDLYRLFPAPAGPLRTVPALKPWADHDGYKIFVWGSDLDPAQDTDAFYEQLIAEGADSYNTPSPTTLAKYLCENGIAAPDGTPRCAQQVCPEGQEGIAPDNCKPIPCPPGTVGTSPNCEPHPDPATTVSKVAITPAKGKIRAGKKTKLTIKVNAKIGLDGAPRVTLKSSNRQVKLPKTIKFAKASSTMKKTITVTATKKAKGKAKITASSGGKKGTATLTVKKAKKK